MLLWQVLSFHKCSVATLHGVENSQTSFCMICSVCYLPKSTDKELSEQLYISLKTRLYYLDLKKTSYTREASPKYL